MTSDEQYMMIALKEAEKAYQKDEVPIGCIIVKKGKIISKAYNKKEKNKMATHHAEILAINKACKKLKTWHLEECVLYTTVEPCLMCTGAIVQSRIKKVVYGTDNKSFGYLKKLENSKIEITSHILEKQCKKILTDFFEEKREKSKNKKHFFC